MRRKTALQLALTVALLNAGILLAPRLLRSRSAELRVVFLDVGQGDSCVIQTPSGRVVVVDAGNRSPDGKDDMGRRVVAPYLRSQGVQRIDLLVLTHPDSDHIGGAVALLDRLPVGMLATNGQDGQPGQKEVAERAKSLSVPIHHARQGETIDLGGGVAALVLAPIGGDANEPTNTRSVVIRLTYRNASLLLTGDADAAEEGRILLSGALSATQLLKVGHHGSRTSTTDPFLRRAAPKIAVISAGKRNAYGHPAASTLERLKKQGTRVFRTDKEGAILCATNGENWGCEAAVRPSE